MLEGFRKRVILTPPHNNNTHPNGDPNLQLYISCVGVHYDPSTKITHLLVKGIGPAQAGQTEDAPTRTAGRRAKTAVFAARSRDHGETIEFIGPDSSTIDRTHAQPVLQSSDTRRRGAYGVQDPRITLLKGPGGEERYLITASALNKDEYGASVGQGVRNPNQPIAGEYAELFTADALDRPESYKSLGFLGPENQFFKNVSIHPETIAINGEPHVLLYCRKLPSIQIYVLPYKDFPQFLEDKDFRERYWQKQLQPENVARHTILEPLFPWEGKGDPNNPEGQIAGGPPPIAVSYADNLGQRKEGWLFVYNAVPSFNENKEPTGGRVIGAALLDKEEPWKVIARSPEPIIVPETEVETTQGRVQNVVFATGGYIDDETNTLRIFYTQGDKNAAVFYGPADAMIDYLLQFNSHGDRVASRRRPHYELQDYSVA